MKRLDDAGAAAFGGLLRKLRAEAGLTQEEVAERSGMSVRSINYLERGSVRPRRQSAEALADALELSDSGRAEFLARSRGRVSAEPAASPRTAQPPARQLPADLHDFTGRADEVDHSWPSSRPISAARPAAMPGGWP